MRLMKMKSFQDQIAGLRMMVDIALGSDETANYYINKFKEGMDKR